MCFSRLSLDAQKLDPSQWPMTERNQSRFRSESLLDDQGLPLAGGRIFGRSQFELFPTNQSAFSIELGPAQYGRQQCLHLDRIAKLLS